MKTLKILSKVFYYTVIAVILFICISNIWVVSTTKDQIYNKLSSLPEYDVAIVLGTSKKIMSGEPNEFFHNRINAAAKLYQFGKVKHFLLSGTNNSVYYNEPKDMKIALIEAGVPDSVISQDFAGRRTLDSVVRGKKIFGQKKITIITQEFHNYRALFIANYYGLEAVGYSAQEVPVYESFKVLLREFFARPKAVIDLYVLKKQPYFLGSKEILDIH